MNAYFNSSVSQVLTGIKRAVSDFIEEHEKTPKRTDAESTAQSLTSPKSPSIEMSSKEDSSVTEEEGEKNSQKAHTNRRAERGKRLSMDEIFSSIPEEQPSPLNVSTPTDTGGSLNQELGVLESSKVSKNKDEDSSSNYAQKAGESDVASATASADISEASTKGLHSASESGFSTDSTTVITVINQPSRQVDACNERPFFPFETEPAADDTGYFCL
ncbi:unnamed protein product [Dibothriocephalus latus]|uniref:Uncharacterized protein n=1 Tax=Dibothriocephalus latus TaxID=60516 RepID=A0A3P7NIM5_DIBLA|nr:unnamed protein product [Dibothriocephalus latus]